MRWGRASFLCYELMAFKNLVTKTYNSVLGLYSKQKITHTQKNKYLVKNIIKMYKVFADK